MTSTISRTDIEPTSGGGEREDKTYRSNPYRTFGMPIATGSKFVGDSAVFPHLFLYSSSLSCFCCQHKLLEINASVSIPVKNAKNLQYLRLNINSGYHKPTWSTNMGASDADITIE